jgi:hypothetical protein
MRHKIFLAALMFSVPLVCRAQVSIPVSEGERVRIESRDSDRPLVGTVNRLSADTLFVTDDRERSHSIATSSIWSAEVSLGKGLSGHNMAVGAFVGAAAMSTYLIISDPSPLLLVEMFLYVPVGALGGAVAGALTPEERWERIEVRKDVRFGLIPSARGVGVQISFR